MKIEIAERSNRCAFLLYRGDKTPSGGFGGSPLGLFCTQWTRPRKLRKTSALHAKPSTRRVLQIVQMVGRNLKPKSTASPVLIRSAPKGIAWPSAATTSIQLRLPLPSSNLRTGVATDRSIPAARSSRLKSAPRSRPSKPRPATSAGIRSDCGTRISGIRPEAWPRSSTTPTRSSK